MIWQGIDREGVQIVIDRDAWERHVLKHPEIIPFLDAVVNTMVEPERDEKIVPPVIATSDRRPGTRAINLSMASIARDAIPV